MTLKNNKTKTMTTIIGALVIGLIMSSPVALLPNVNAQTLSYRDHPLPPQVQGCYHYTNTTGWKNISCATEDELKQIRAHPPMEGNTYGIYGVTALNTKVTFGKVDVKFTQYSGESDSKKGTNTWSIQTNTNYFNGNNGQKDWVQFVYQNSPNSSYRNNFCTWQVVDVQPGPADFSNVHCVTSGLPPTQTLSSSYEAYTTGSYLSGSITGEFCINSGAQCWGVVTTDSYNLHSNWVDTSGTILGHSDLSVANFVSPTTETTTVTSTPETSMQEDPDTTTGEENNLSYTTHSWACNPTCTDTSTSHV
jgi:hypothetical protein